MLEMVVAQSSTKNSIVMDCFAGSGSTLLAASNLGEDGSASINQTIRLK
jgi:adenine-specific DNA-methyltransferase